MKNFLSQFHAISRLYQYLVRRMYLLRGYIFLKKSNKDFLYIICPYGIGDILVGDMVANRIRGNKKKIVFLIRDCYTELSDVLDNVDECILDTQLVLAVEAYILEYGRFQGGNYVYGHFHKKKDRTVLYGMNVNDYVWQDYCTYVYGIEKDCLYHIADRKFIDNVTVNMRDIIICPYAYSTNNLPMKFWEMLVAVLHERGYVVYTNVSKKEEEVIGTKRLECPLNKIPVIANKARAVIALRSGICDLLAIKSSVPLYIINMGTYWNLEYLRGKNVYGFAMTDNTLDNILNKLN